MGSASWACSKMVREVAVWPFSNTFFFRLSARFLLRCDTDGAGCEGGLGGVQGRLELERSGFCVRGARSPFSKSSNMAPEFSIPVASWTSEVRSKVRL
jgi:hypothetical protein